MSKDKVKIAVIAARAITINKQPLEKGDVYLLAEMDAALAEHFAAQLGWSAFRVVKATADGKPIDEPVKEKPKPEFITKPQTLKIVERLEEAAEAIEREPKADKARARELLSKAKNIPDPERRVVFYKNRLARAITALENAVAGKVKPAAEENDLEELKGCGHETAIAFGKIGIHSQHELRAAIVSPSDADRQKLVDIIGVTESKLATWLKQMDEG